MRVNMYKGMWPETVHLTRYVVNKNGCWIWQGPTNSVGYGQLHNRKKKTVLAHRWFYELLVKPIEKGKVLDHSCNNKLCVCPAHLHETTQKENARRGYSRNKWALMEWLQGQMEY